MPHSASNPSRAAHAQIAAAQARAPLPLGARRLRGCASAAAVLLLLGATLVNQSAVHWREDLIDSQLFSYYGWCITQGERPYADFWDNKPPGVFWVNAAAIALCKDVTIAEIVASSGAMFGTLLGAWVALTAIYRERLGPIGAGVAVLTLTHLQYECGSNRTETWVMLCEVWAVAGYASWRNTGRRGSLLLAALAAGAAPLFKQVGIAVTLACLVDLALLAWRGRIPGPARRWTAWVVPAVCLALPILTAATVLAAQGALHDAYFAVVAVNRYYFVAQDASWTNLRPAIDLFLPELYALQGVACLAGVGLLLDALSAARRRGLRLGLVPGTNAHPAASATASADSSLGAPPTHVLWLWLAISADLACVGPGRQAHHLMPLLAPLALLAARPLAALAGAETLGARMTARPSATALVVVCFFVLAQFAGSGLRIADAAWRQKTHWLGLPRREPLAVEQQAAAALALIPENGSIYVWGWHPGVYRYALRPHAARYPTLEKVYPLRPHLDFMPRVVLQSLRDAPPDAILVSQFDLHWMRADPRHPLAVLLAERYRDGPIIDGWQVFSLVLRSREEFQAGG